jgi:DNA polymerase-4
MPIFKASALCKTLLTVTPKYYDYEKYSILFMDYIKQNYTNKIEVLSIDECYINVTDLVKNNDYLSLAKDIQKNLKSDTGLSCSIGISYNKFLAKMATDFNKPYGISTLFKNELGTKLYPLKINSMYMIGAKTAAELKYANINYIGDLIKNENLLAIKKIFKNK